MLYILHINDTDTTRPGDWAPVAAAIRRLQEAGRCDLLLHAGDITMGSETGGDMVELLNELGFDAIVPGNHEFDHGILPLRQQMAAFKGAVLCANASGFRPYLTLERKGMRIALTGVLLPDLTLLQPPRNLEGLQITGPAESLRRLVPELRRQADLVVVISHCGLAADRELARSVPGIDLIVGGHSHHLLTAPVHEGGTLIVQAGAYGQHVGCVTLSSGRSLHAEVIPTESTQPARQAAPAPPVAYTETDLRSGDYARETPLGNLTADLMRDAAGTDLALLRCSSVHNAYPPGPLTLDDVRGMNFCGIDRVARLELTGADLRAVLECGARDAYYLLTLSGGRVIYDGSRPLGRRVVDLSPGEPDRVFSVACSEILARGAAGFRLLAGRPYELTNVTVGELLHTHVTAAQSIKPATDGRLRIIGALPRERQGPAPERHRSQTD